MALEYPICYYGGTFSLSLPFPPPLRLSLSHLRPLGVYCKYRGVRVRVCVSESVFDFAIMSTSVDFTISTATRRVDVALQWEAT